MDTRGWKWASEAHRLAGLGLVWGFLKHHHPKVATGALDWDQVLIDAVNRVRTTASFEEFNQQIRRLVDAAGKLESSRRTGGSQGLLDPNLNPSWCGDGQLYTEPRPKSLNLDLGRLENRGLFDPAISERSEPIRQTKRRKTGNWGTRIRTWTN